MKFQAGNEINEHSGGIEELTTLIQQEVDARANAKEKEIEEKAVREFADWIQKQAHGYNATVYIPTNQEYTRVCDIYALVEQFIAERNKYLVDQTLQEKQ